MGHEAYLDDLKLSITNELFGGEGVNGEPGSLSAGDCAAECVYSYANRWKPDNCVRTVNGPQCEHYMAYHWDNDYKCWQRVTANWCLETVEVQRYFDLSTAQALAWRFPAFKVKNFCPPSMSPTPEPS